MSNKYAITNEQIDGFFDLLPDLLKKKDSLKNKVEDDEGKTRTNIIYITTRCDYECDYCYELEARKDLTIGVDVDKNQIDEFLQEISLREEGLNSAVVIFGGEPFLRYDLVEYLVLRAVSMKKLGGFNFNPISNGNWLAQEKNMEKFAALIKLAEENHCQISVTISYDGTGNMRRVTKNGRETTKRAHKTFENLNKFKIPFEISYTVHAANMDLLEYDIRKIHKDIGPKRVKLSWAYADIDKVLGEGKSFDFEQRMKKELIPVYKDIQTPICYMVCEECRQCDFEKHAGNAYMSPTKGLKYSESMTNTEFELF